jgi:hypothetical protein
MIVRKIPNVLPKFEDMLDQVIDSTCRKLVRFSKLLKQQAHPALANADFWNF